MNVAEVDKNQAAFYIYPQADNVEIKIVDSGGKSSCVLFGDKEDILKLGGAMVQWYIKEKECSE